MKIIISNKKNDNNINIFEFKTYNLTKIFIINLFETLNIKVLIIIGLLSNFFGTKFIISFE